MFNKLKRKFDSQTLRRIMFYTGLILMVLAILYMIGITILSYKKCEADWINNINGFGKKYASPWDCFITRSTGGFLVTLLESTTIFIIGYKIFINR